MRLFFIFLWLHFMSAVAQAYKPAPPRSHITPSPDGRFVFVMLSPESLDRELGHWNEETQAQIRAIRDRWPRSGMYRNDGSTLPLWSVDWFAYSVDVPSDGDHVVRYTSGGYGWTGAPALAFYRRGELLRSYKIADLVTFPALIDHGSWLAETHLSDDAHTVAVRTETEERYVFNFQTGDPVSRFRPLRYMAVGLILVVVGVPTWLVWRWRQKRNQMAAANRSIEEGAGL